MAALDGKFVVVLDHLADRYGPEILPISIVRDRWTEIADVGQYGGDPPTLVSLAGYRAEPRGTARLVDVRSGEALPARVYRLAATTDG